MLLMLQLKLMGNANVVLVYLVLIWCNALFAESSLLLFSRSRWDITILGVNKKMFITGAKNFLLIQYKVNMNNNDENNNKKCSNRMIYESFIYAHFSMNRAFQRQWTRINNARQQRRRRQQRTKKAKQRNELLKKMLPYHSSHSS